MENKNYAAQENPARIKVYQTICYENPSAIKTLTPETKLADIGYDSEEMSMLGLDLEQEFDIRIEDGDLRGFCALATVEDVVNYVTQKLKK